MMDHSNNHPESLAMMGVSMLIFGSIGIFRKYIPLSSAFLAFARGLLGGLFILFFMMISGKAKNSRPPRRQRLLLALTGAMIGVNWILLFEAYAYTSVAIATLCYYMQPTIVMLLSPLVFHERLTPKKAVCALIAIIGMVLVSGVAGGAPQSASTRGVLLGLGAAVFYAVVVMLNKLLTGVDAYQKTMIQLFSAGLVMAPYLFLSNGFSLPDTGPCTVFLTLTVGIVHTGVAYVLYFKSMDGLRVQSIALLSYADPVFALLLSAIFLKEPLTLPALIGALMIIGSAVAGEIRQKT